MPLHAEQIDTKSINLDNPNNFLTFFPELWFSLFDCS